MKKFLLILAAAIGSVFVRNKLQASKNEQALWAEATDNVEKANPTH